MHGLKVAVSRHAVSNEVLVACNAAGARMVFKVNIIIPDENRSGIKFPVFFKRGTLFFRPEHSNILYLH